MPLSCEWQTVADWATLVGQDVSIYADVVAQGGDAYTRVCEDGTVWLERTLALTISGSLP